jgi:tetratricopeptide (TPR) repeat protein
LILLGTGVVAWVPGAHVVRDPLVDRLEVWLEQPAGPYQSDHVDDRADVLGPFAQAVDRLALAFWSDLGIDVQVVTLDAPGEVMSVVVDRLFRERQSPERPSTGALLVVIERSERRARIEPSYDLEGAFPDVLLKRLAADQLAPYASYQASGMAVMDVLHLLKDAALEQAARGTLPLAEDLRAGAAFQERLAELSGGGGAAVSLSDLPTDAVLKQRVAEDQRGRYAPRRNPYKTIEAYRRVLRDLVGDPTLDLFTPGSRVMRQRSPFAPYEQQRRLRALDRSRPLRLAQQGDRAVAVSDSAAPGFVPVLMYRRDGLWRVDLVETWKNLFFDAQGEYMLHNTSSPYAFALAHLRQGQPRGLKPVELGEEDLGAAIERLSGRADARGHLDLAELLMRNCFVTVDALAHYEEAARLAPADLEVARVYAERALYLGLTDLAIAEFRRAGPGAWTRLAHAYGAAGDYGRSERFYRRALTRNPRSGIAREGLEWARRQRERAPSR